MKIIQTIAEMQAIIQANKDKEIGFVPTMGYLHEGHLSLARKAREDNDLVVMSIFVNPLQFGPNEDFDQYPRDEARDQELAAAVGVDYLFFPTSHTMYPNPLSLKMTMTDRVNVLCGASRPGHFDGVVTVVTKLFHIVQPQRAYFGLKDAQQVAVIDALITDLNFPIELVAMETVREADGLAMSSRNQNLSKEERKNALCLYNSLQFAQRLIKKGNHDANRLKNEIWNYLESQCHGTIDYVELWDYPTLTSLSTQSDQLVIALAITYEKARLIDNFILDWEGNQKKLVEF